MFNLSDSLLVVAKDTREVGGKTYYNVSLSNGQRCNDFGCEPDVYASVDVGKKYRFVFDYLRGFKNGRSWVMVNILSVLK